MEKKAFQLHSLKVPRGFYRCQNNTYQRYVDGIYQHDNFTCNFDSLKSDLLLTLGVTGLDIARAPTALAKTQGVLFVKSEPSGDDVPVYFAKNETSFYHVPVRESTCLVYRIGADDY